MPDHERSALWASHGKPLADQSDEDHGTENRKDPTKIKKTAPS